MGQVTWGGCQSLPHDERRQFMRASPASLGGPLGFRETRERGQGCSGRSAGIRGSYERQESLQNIAELCFNVDVKHDN